MRTYTMTTTTWGDGWTTTDLFDARGQWADNITVPTDSYQDAAAYKLEYSGYENIEWQNGTPIACTQDEHKTTRELLELMGPDSIGNLPAPDENTDWQLDVTGEYETPQPDPVRIQSSNVRAAFQSLVNQALRDDDIQVSFLRDPDGLFAGWGSVPVQIHGLIGPDARTATVSTDRARLFYFRLRSNTARLEVYPDRNVPRDHMDRLGDVIETSSIYPVVEGDDYLGDLPDDIHEAAGLFTSLVHNLAAPEAVTNPSYSQNMYSWLVPAAIARELAGGGIDAADTVARTYLGVDDARAYAQQWLNMPAAKKERALANCS